MSTGCTKRLRYVIRNKFGCEIIMHSWYVQHIILLCVFVTWIVYPFRFRSRVRFFFHLFNHSSKLSVSTWRMSRTCSKCNQKPSREPYNDDVFLKGVKIRRFCTANMICPFIDTVIYTVNILDTMLLCTREGVNKLPSRDWNIPYILMLMISKKTVKYHVGRYTSKGVSCNIHGTYLIVTTCSYNEYYKLVYILHLRIICCVGIGSITKLLQKQIWKI